MPAHVLLIEDSPNGVDLMVASPKDYGYIPISADDSEAGVGIASLAQRDLIICSVQLPRPNGYSVIRNHKYARDHETISVVDGRNHRLRHGRKPREPARWVRRPHLQTHQTRASSTVHGTPFARG